MPPTPFLSFAGASPMWSAGPPAGRRSMSEAMADLRVGKRSIPLPASRAARIALGGALIAGGLFGFLPVIGFWMLPLGLVVLSVDLPAVRRARRRLVVWWHRRRRPRAAATQESKPDREAGQS